VHGLRAQLARMGFYAADLGDGESGAVKFGHVIYSLDHQSFGVFKEQIGWFGLDDIAQFNIAAMLRMQSSCCLNKMAAPREGHGQ